jgi:aspartokinase-like uncharacterized kinase
MEAVLKVGGSLAEKPARLKKLCQKLCALAAVHRVLVVPGGGRFADVVREVDRGFGLSDEVAHKMAILAMDQYGLLLSDVAPDSCVSFKLEDVCSAPLGLLPILLPSKHMFCRDPLENSWDTTSDAIAAYVAGVLDAEKLILVTDVDGIFLEDPKQNVNGTCIGKLSAEELMRWDKRTSVDKVLPKLVLESKLDCYVVNGGFPERIENILENKKTVCTHVTC